LIRLGNSTEIDTRVAFLPAGFGLITGNYAT
jgi:hypothetical protein